MFSKQGVTTLSKIDILVTSNYKASSIELIGYCINEAKFF